MSDRAWQLLCDVIEFPAHPFYADLMDRHIVQELADRGLIAIVRTGQGFAAVCATREGMHEYRVIN